MPDAAAWVSVGELSEADGLLGPRELRAMRIWEGLVVMDSVQIKVRGHCVQCPGCPGRHVTPMLSTYHCQ